MNCNVIKFFSFCFLPPSPFIYSAHNILQFMASSSINCNCILILLISEFNLLSPCNVSFISIFVTDHLAMDNQLIFSTLGRTASPIPYLWKPLYNSLSNKNTLRNPLLMYIYKQNTLTPQDQGRLQKRGRKRQNLARG